MIVLPACVEWHAVHWLKAPGMVTAAAPVAAALIEPDIELVIALLLAVAEGAADGVGVAEAAVIGVALGAASDGFAAGAMAGVSVVVVVVDSLEGSFEEPQAARASASEAATAIREVIGSSFELGIGRPPIAAAAMRKRRSRNQAGNSGMVASCAGESAPLRIGPLSPPAARAYPGRLCL